MHRSAGFYFCLLAGVSKRTVYNMNILVIRFTSMGDVICVTPLFTYLHEKFPDAKVYFLTDAKYAELFKDDSRIFQAIGQEKSRKKDPILQLIDVHWDRVVDLQNNHRSVRVRKSLLFRGTTGIVKKNYLPRMLLLFMRMNFYDPFDTVPRRYIKAGTNHREAPEDIPPLKVVLEANNCKVIHDSFFSNGVIRPVIALIPFSSWKNKEWPRHYFLYVGRYFLSKGWHVVILGGPNDRSAAEELKKGIGPRCSALAGRISLYQSACVLKRCSLALGNDTGLSHLARACGVKTGIVYGSTTFHFGFFPFSSPSYRVFQTEIFCRPCHPHGGNFCLLSARLCLKRIKPDVIIRGLEELYLCT
jgi:heptosyltransferase-2